jgi:hypothetical protein
MIMRAMSIEVALDVSETLLKQRAMPFFIIQALLNDDFTHQQAESIVLWAIQKIKVEREARAKTNVQNSETPSP